jgi:hypothetical protein
MHTQPTFTDRVDARDDDDDHYKRPQADLTRAPEGYINPPFCPPTFLPHKIEGLARTLKNRSATFA